MRKANIVGVVLASLMLTSTLASGQGERPPADLMKETPAFGKAMTAREQIPGGASDPSRITYLRLYCTPDGNSHFQSVTGQLRKTDFAPPAAPLNIGNRMPASTAFFGGFDAGWGAHDLETRLYHPTPAVQFFIVLAGEFSITVTDGEARRFQPGSVLRLEDAAPCKGHITVVGNKPGFAMFVR